MAENDKHPDRQDLASIRKRIDEIDERIQSLINERARYAQEVGVSKGELASAVDYYRPEREADEIDIGVCNVHSDKSRKFCAFSARSCRQAWRNRNH